MKACRPAGLQNTAGNKTDSVSDKAVRTDAQDCLLTSVCVDTLTKRNVQTERKYPYCIHTERGRGEGGRGEREEEREEERIGERGSREGEGGEGRAERQRQKTLSSRDHICYS